MKVRLFQNPPRMTVSEFAEKSVVLEEGAARGQRFSYANRPFFRAPTDAMGDNIHNSRVVLVTPTQLGKTTAFLNYLFYLITYDPDNTLIILDSNKSAEKLVKVRIKPFLRNQVQLESLQRGLKKDYESSSTNTNISLAAGKNLLIGSARSASDLCSFSCKYLLCDETSRYPDCLENEGDPITLALQRQETYTRSMSILTSTPTTQDCTIWKHYLTGTQERWSAICECGHYMPVEYKDIDFTDIDNPTYSCPKCGQVYTEKEIQYTLKHAYAPPSNPEPLTDMYGRIVRSFWVTGTLCPMRYSWKYLREKEIAARQLGPSAYASFINTSLGEIYHPGVDESLNLDRILSCKKYFTKDKVPSWVEFVSCGIDTQDDRFESIVIGSDRHRNHICFIERRVFLGDLRKPDVWNNLHEYLNSFRATTKDKRQMPIQMACIDSGGHFTQDVYAFCLRSPRIRAVKGSSSHCEEKSMIHRISDMKVKAYANGAGKIPLTFVNTLYGKDIIRHNMLQIQIDPNVAPWVISSDLDANFDIAFFEQINAEYRESLRNGKYRWICKQHVRNEALDCTVYALTGIDLIRLVIGQAANRDDEMICSSLTPNESDPADELTLQSISKSIAEQEFSESKTETKRKTKVKRIL